MRNTSIMYSSLNFFSKNGTFGFERRTIFYWLCKKKSIIFFCFYFHNYPLRKASEGDILNPNVPNEPLRVELVEPVVVKCIRFLK